MSWWFIPGLAAWWLFINVVAMVVGWRPHDVHAKGWVFMRRMDLAGPDGGDLYLRRFYLVRTKRWGGLMLHHIVRGDHDPTLHSHPWPFWSLILRGGYTEKLADVHTHEVEGWSFLQWHREETHRRGSFRKFPEGSVHRIDTVEPSTWTLVVNGKYRGGWGFWVEDEDGTGEVMPWLAYLRATGRDEFGKLDTPGLGTAGQPQDLA